MKKKKTLFIILFLVILIAQIFAKIYVDCEKSDFFIDEFYSYALMNYKIPFIFQEETFMNNWHDNSYFKDYVSIQKDEVLNIAPVYTNQVKDVHPPFYYLLLRITSTFFIDTFSKWPGLILNLIIYIFSAILVFKIAKKLFKNNWYALISLFAYGFSVFSTENTLYIRMYQLFELNLLLITYWHIKNYNTNLKLKNYMLLILLVVLGFLTHYYYILFFIGLYLIYFFNYIKNKEYKLLLKYTGTLLLAGGIILLIFPYCLSHLFLGYRGSNSIYKLFNITNTITFIKGYLGLINSHIFVNGFSILFITLIFIKLILILYKYIKTKKISFNIKKELLFVTIPVIFYLLIVIRTSPFVDIRYISPIMVYILLFTIYFIQNILNNFVHNKKIVITLMSIIVLIFTIPNFIYHKGFLYIYNEQKEVFDMLKKEYRSVPCIYIYASASEMFNSFVYDYNFILQSDKVYVTDGITPETAPEIIKNVDTSKGILIYDKEYNLPNILRFIELKEFNSYRIINKSYNCSIFYVYYDNDLPN